MKKQNRNMNCIKWTCLNTASVSKASIRTGFRSSVLHHVVNGVAVVDKEACKACGKCVAVCPKHLIEIVPYDQKHLVKCNSQDKGKAVMQACTAGCIGCKMCEKACKFEAVTVENNIAHIDYEKCKDCGACAVKCPKKVIS